MPDFYTPSLARKLGLTSPVWYDMTFRALCTSHSKEVHLAWSGGHHACADQLASLARQELRDRVIAMRALCGRNQATFRSQADPAKQAPLESK